MLGQPQHLDKKHLQLLADLEWRTPDASPGAWHASCRSISRACSTMAIRCGPIALDPSLVAQARSTIRQASIPQIVLGQTQAALMHGGRSARRFGSMLIAGSRHREGVQGARADAASSPNRCRASTRQAVFKEVTGLGKVAWFLIWSSQFAEDDLGVGYGRRVGPRAGQSSSAAGHRALRAAITTRPGTTS